MEWEWFPSVLFYWLPWLESFLVQGHRGNVLSVLLVVGGGLTAFPWVPPSLFNTLARVGHSLAMCPQPWHLKHCKELESLLLCAPPCTPFCTLIFPLCGDSMPPLLVIEELWMEVVWPRPVQPLWELGQTGVFLSVHPLPRPLCLGLLGALAGQLPHSALVKATISLAIWSPSSFKPEVTSVVAADLASTFSLASSV